MYPGDTTYAHAAQGERVRSKSEWIITNLLEKNGIPFHYEYPIYLKGFGTVYPDFYVLNIKKRKAYIWEHFGMMENEEYVQKAIRKIMTYEKNGYRPGEDLIITYETQKQPLDVKHVQSMIDYYLK